MSAASPVGGKWSDEEDGSLRQGETGRGPGFRVGGALEAHGAGRSASSCDGRSRRCAPLPRARWRGSLAVRARHRRSAQHLVGRRPTCGRLGASARSEGQAGRAVFARSGERRSGQLATGAPQRPAPPAPHRLWPAGVQTLGAKNWKRISEEYLQGRRTDVQCLHRWQKVLRPGLVKGPWTTEEDQVIVNCINAGITKWSEISERIPLAGDLLPWRHAAATGATLGVRATLRRGPAARQCRERWFNHLDPSIKKDPWSAEEDRILEEAQCSIGNKWCEIAKLLPGRSENSVKNRWNSAMRRKRHAERLKAQGAPDEAVRAAAKVPRAKTSGKRRHSGSGSATQSRRVTTTEDGSEPLPSVYPSAGGAGGAATPDTDGLGAPPSLAPSAGGTGAHGQGQVADSATAAAAEAMGA
ncbi:MYB3R3, partial [Symbiodinium sp. KB8]